MSSSVTCWVEVEGTGGRVWEERGVDGAAPGSRGEETPELELCMAL